MWRDFPGVFSVRGRRVPLALGLLLLGTTVLAMTWIGQWPGPKSATTRGAASAIATGDDERVLQQRAALVQYVADIHAGMPLDLERATALIYQGTEHGDQRRINLSENWTQWLAGQFYAPLLRTQDADRLLAGGVGDCSERAAILKSICEAADCPCRFVGLSGHVVLEVFIDGQWQTADPDYGVTFPATVQALETPRLCDAVTARLVAQRYDAATVARYVSILQSSDDNAVMPIGAALSPRLERAERVCQMLSWLIPALLVLGGVVLLAMQTNRRFRRLLPQGAWSTWMQSRRGRCKANLAASGS